MESFRKPFSQLTNHTRVKKKHATYTLDLLYCNSETKKKQELLMIKILPTLNKDQPRKITTPKTMKSSWQ